MNLSMADISKLKKAAWIVSVACLVTVTLISIMIAGLFLLPETGLTRHKFPSLLDLKRELTEGAKIGRSLLWSQFDIAHSKAAFKNTKLRTYNIKIGPRAYKKILDPIKVWSEKGAKIPDVAEWANANFFYDGKMWRVKIRLAGKRVDHWLYPKKSFSIKFPKQDLFFGQRVVKLYPPYNKGGIITGQLLFWMAGNTGLLAPRSEYVVLNLNGVYQGVYFAVEDYRKELLAHNRRSESPVYDLEKETFYLFGHSIVDNGMKRVANFSSLIKMDGPLKDIADSKISECLSWAFNSSEEDLVTKAEKYLDLDKFISFEAIRSIYRDDHGEIGSSKLYYNITTGKFEPVIWDAYIPKVWMGDLWEGKTPEFGYQGFPLCAPYEFNKFLRNPDNHLAYNKALYRLINSGILEKYDDIYKEVERGYLSSKIRKIGLKIGYLTKKELEGPRKFLETKLKRIKTLLEGKGLDQGVFILADNDSKGKSVRFDFEVFSISDLLLKGINIPFQSRAGLPGTHFRLIRDSNENEILDKDDTLLGETVCKGNILKLEQLNIRFSCLRDEEFKPHLAKKSIFLTWDNDKILLDAKEIEKTGFDFFNLVTEQKYDRYLSLKLINKAEPEQGTYFYSKSLENYVEKYPDVFKMGKNHIEIRSGKHYIDKTIIFPEGSKVIISKGSVLNLSPDVSILIQGNLEINGNSENPVTIRCSDKNRSFGAVSVLKGNAVIRGLQIGDGNEAIVNGVYFSGQLCVYHGDLDIKNSTIYSSRSDDGLNVKYGRVSIKNNFFKANSGDAIDLDFCTGEVAENVITGTESSNGDGIDLSGSKIVLMSNKVSMCGDKGISIGEKSNAEIINNIIFDNNIGIAIKDLSFAKIYSSTIANNNTGISLYQKKPAFGEGSAEVVNSILSNGQDVLLDKNSKIKAFRTASATEKRYGLNKVKARFDSKDKEKFVLSKDNSTFVLQGADRKAVEKFIKIKRAEYPLGAIHR